MRWIYRSVSIDYNYGEIGGKSTYLIIPGEMDDIRKACDAMAGEIYKIGDIQFETKEEYELAQSELKKINEIMKGHDTKNPSEAAVLLAELGEDHGFKTAFGMNFIKKLKATAEKAPKASGAAISTKATPDVKAKVISNEASPEKKETKSKKNNNNTNKSKIHIITARNVIIVAVIAVVAVAASIVVPRILGVPGLFNCAPANTPENEHRNLVLQYAKNQLQLQGQLVSYYKASAGIDAQTAKTEANNTLANAYAMNLADENVADMTDREIEEIYNSLMMAGDIEAGGFNEPTVITELKENIAQSQAAGITDVNEDGDMTNITDEAELAQVKINLVNSMMDYQARVAAQYRYDYSHFGLDADDIQECVAEDMEKMFIDIIYDATLSDGEKELYYDSFIKSGALLSTGPVEIATSPKNYSLPDMTPQVELMFDNGFKATALCSQQTIAPKAEVTYALYGDNVEGFMMFRANGTGTDYIQDENGSTVMVQGEFYMKIDSQITVGNWYINANKIGIIVDDYHFGDVACVYDIVYQDGVDEEIEE